MHRLGRLEESGVLRGEDPLVVVGHGLAGEELQWDNDQDPDDDADGAADAHLEVEEGDDDDDLEEVNILSAPRGYSMYLGGCAMTPNK